jgi:hypothetical protein
MAGMAEDAGTHGVNPFAGRDVNWLQQLRAKTRWELALLIWEPFEGCAQVSIYAQFQDRVLRVAAGGISAASRLAIACWRISTIRLSWNSCGSPAPGLVPLW